jgi:hypothetical protein
MLPCNAKLTTRPITLRPDGVGATLEDLPPTVFPLQCVQDLFTFSPFGLSCRQCEKQVQIKFDERCIRDHLKKHCMDSRMSTVRSLLLRFSERANVIKATGTINSFRHDEKAYIGYLCVCVDNLFQGKTMHFDTARSQLVMICNCRKLSS